MERENRMFEDKPALRERVPLLVGIMGPSGGGKTYSALRLATGIQRVAGGEVYVIDTESRRSLHYADKFKFRHVQFDAPFGSLDYLAAIEHCVNKGAGVVIVDSMSHEHEGPGGVLETHERELERLSGGDRAKMERVNMLAWAKPKADRRRLINSILQLNANFIFCFRAKEKIKMVKGGQPEDLGWMPIAGEEFLYEMTINCLLPPNANGVPAWQAQHRGEQMMIKLPVQFRALFATSDPLNESTGETLAKWAAGEGNGHNKKEPAEIKQPKDTIGKLIDAFGSVGVDRVMIEEKLGHSLEKSTDYEIKHLREVYKSIEKGSTTWNELLGVAN